MSNNFINIAVFASGGGSNFQELINKHKEGKLHVNLALMIGNNSSAKAFSRAQAYSIPTRHIAPSHFNNSDKYTAIILKILAEYNIDYIVLAGYMKMIPKGVVQKFKNHIVNIHPGLLPAFGGQGMYGEKVHNAVLEYGAKISGITVHFVDEKYDHGPIIFQRTVPVMDNDTVHDLADRVLAIEHDTLWKVVEAISAGVIKIDGRIVKGMAK